MIQSYHIKTNVGRNKDMRNIGKSIISNSTAYYESKKHTDTMFAYNVYPCTIPLDFSFVPIHWQDSAELIYVKGGTGRIQVDLDTYIASEGDLFLVMPGHIHGIRCLPGHSMIYENIIFDLDFLGSSNIDLCSQKYWQPLINEKISLPVHIGPEHPLHTKLCSCLDESDVLCDQRPEGYELAVKGNLMICFSLLFPYAVHSISGNPKDTQKLKAALAYLEEHYNQKLTVEKMACHCGYSASHFMRWFKEKTGVGFNSYLIEYRLDRAAHELRSGNLTILEIAEKSGFDNLSNFNRLFRKRFEMTPSQFRKSGL